MYKAAAFKVGITDAGNACRNTIRHSGTPESRARSTNSLFIVSMNPALSKRLKWATWPMITVRAGRNETARSSNGPASLKTTINAGNIGIQTAKTTINTVPITKSGIE